VIRHVFLWSVRADADGDAVLAKLAELEHLVPGIRGFTIGKHQGASPNASTGRWEYALTCDFSNMQELDSYQTHPQHEKIVRNVAASYLDWLVLDYVIE
jgi:hypothetical protein